MRKKLLAVSILLICLVNLSIAQQMYKWKDANGQYHYTDSPAEAAKKNAATVDRPTPQIISTTAALSPEQIEERRAQDAQQAQQNAQMAEQLARLKAYCDQKQAFIKSLKNWGRITVQDTTQKDGYRYLTDEEVKANIAKEEDDYNSRCRGV